MKAAHRRKLEGLRQREADKPNTARLAVILTKNFVHRFGTSRAKDIQVYVEKCLKNHPKPSDKDFEDLAEQINLLHNPTKLLKPSNPNETQCFDSLVSQITTRNDGATEFTRPNQGETAIKGPLDIYNAWQAFDIAKQIEYEDFQDLKRKKNEAEKEKNRLERIKRRDEKLKREKLEAEEKKKERESIENQLQQWTKDIEKKKHMAIQISTEENRLRLLQIEESQKRIEAERIALLQHEKKKFEQLSMEARREALKAEEQKAIERARAQLLLQETIEHKKESEQEEKKIAIEDARLVQEFAKNQDRIQAERKQNIRNRMKRHDEKMEFWHSRGLDKKEIEEAKKMEMQLQNEAQAIEKAQKERELCEAELRRNGCIYAALENKRVAAEKMRQQQHTNIDEVKYAEYVQLQSENARKAEVEKAAKKLADMEKYRQELDEQSLLNAVGKNRIVDMTETEALYNSELVKKLKQDAILQERVKAKLGKVS